MWRFTISYSRPVMQCRALQFFWPFLPCTWLTLPLSHSCFQCCSFFSYPLRAALSVWMCLSAPYSWCLLFSSQQASQMASLKVLIDAQCLLIKKLLSLRTTAVHRHQHKYTAVWRQPQGRRLKSKKWQQHQQGRNSISTEGRQKKDM